MGVSMFFMSCIVSQLVYSLGGSGFACANGSMMIEVVVCFFLHLVYAPLTHHTPLTALFPHDGKLHLNSNRRK